MPRLPRARTIRALLAALLAFAAAALAVYHAWRWPITALLAARAWEAGGLGPALLLSLAFVIGAALLLIGAVLLTRGYYSMAARFILAGGVLSAYGDTRLALGLSLSAALLGGTIRPPEDTL